LIQAVTALKELGAKAVLALVLRHGPGKVKSEDVAHSGGPVEGD
jgi:hypothetical protein